MGSRVTDSALYGHLWGTDELRGIFDEHARIDSWLGILVALAEAQADLGIVPSEAAMAIAANASVDALDLDYVAEQTRLTGHSTLGLIRGLERILPADASAWVYYGATVQDLTDTWAALASKRVGAIVWGDLRDIEASALELARTHRDTPMAGRTHGQPGAPITFGLKAAGWADEIRRHLDRLREASPRVLVGQLGGAVGNLAFYHEHGPELRRRFCDRLGLADPGVSWTTARDRLAEFVNILAMIAATLARIGNEVYQLQRPEIGELREPALPGGVSSITMPHKRNPELCEHVVTLSRLIRAQAGLVLEGMVQEHERDGRGWKVEWVAFPEACLLVGAALSFTKRVVAGLEVDASRMRRNIEGGLTSSEQLLAILSPMLGKHRAQDRLQELLSEADRAGLSLAAAVAAAPDLASLLPAEVVASLMDPDVGASGPMVDVVLRRAEEARASEPGSWP